MTDDERALWVQVHEGNADALLVLADLWEESGRPESTGLRWLADRGVRPLPLSRGTYWYWSEGRLPAEAREVMRAEVGDLYWLRASFVEAMTLAARGLADASVQRGDVDHTP